MPVLKKTQWEIFALATARGLNAGEAYLEAYPNSTKKAAHTSGHDLLKNPEIVVRIAEVRGKVAERVEMTLAEAGQIAEDILRAKPIEAGMENPLCDLKMSKAGPYCTFPGKLEALDRLARLKGWYTDKVENTTTVKGLDELLASIVRPGLPRLEKDEEAK